MIFIPWIIFLILFLFYYIFIAIPNSPNEGLAGIADFVGIIYILFIIVLSLVIQFISKRFPKSQIWKFVIVFTVGIIILVLIYQVIDGELLFWNTEEVIIDVPKSNIDQLNP